MRSESSTGLGYGPEFKKRQQEGGRRLVKAATMKVDERPMYQARFEERSEYLNKVIEELSAADINEALDEIERQRQAKGVKEDESRKLLNLADLLRELSVLRANSPSERTRILERLATTKFFKAGAAERANLSNEKVGDALYQLSLAVTNLGRAKFPKEVDRQQKAHDKDEEGKIKAARDRLMKIKVS